VCNKIPEGDCIESFCGVIKGGVVYIVDGRRKLVMCDGGYNKVGVPCLSFSKVGGAFLFAGRSSGRVVDRIFGGGCCRDVKCSPVALKVEDRVLEEVKVSFSMSTRAQNGREVGG
jgi:hypothetical protein